MYNITHVHVNTKNTRRQFFVQFFCDLFHNKSKKWDSFKLVQSVLTISVPCNFKEDDGDDSGDGDGDGNDDDDNHDEKEIIYRMAKSSKQSNESLKQQKMTTTTTTTTAPVAVAAAAIVEKQKQNITRATQILLFITVIHFNFLRIISMIMTVSTWSNAECVFCAI